MNGKFILLIMMCINIVSLLITAGFQSENPNSDYALGSNYIFNTFFSAVDVNEVQNQTIMSFNETTSEGIDELDNEQASGSFLETLSGGVSFILDTFKMIVGFLSILTPIPMIAFFGSLGFPLWLSILIGSPLILLYVMAIFEFVGNRVF